MTKILWLVFSAGMAAWCCRNADGTAPRFWAAMAAVNAFCAGGHFVFALHAAARGKGAR